MLGWVIVCIGVVVMCTVAAATGQFRDRPHDSQWRN